MADTKQPQEDKKTEKQEEKKEKKQEKKDLKLSANLQKLVDQVEKLSVIELSQLVKALEDKFEVTATPIAAPVALAGAPAPGVEGQAAGGQQAEEKAEVSLTIASAGANKIGVIKAVREVKPDLGLKEAKELVESAPKELLTGVKPKEAEEAKKKLEKAGAQVEIK